MPRTLSIEMDRWLAEQETAQALAKKQEQSVTVHEAFMNGQTKPRECTSPLWARNAELLPVHWRWLWNKFRGVRTPMVGFARRLQCAGVPAADFQQRGRALGRAIRTCGAQCRGEINHMTEQPTTPQSHHEFSPSKFPAWSECPCFDSEQDLEDAEIAATEIPDGTAPAVDMSAKGRGTAQHEALAKVMLRQPDPFAGLSEREATQVRWVAEKYVEIIEGAGYRVEDAAVEQRLTLLGPDFKVLYFGTGDLEFGPFILDAKFGDEHHYFAQMAGYALAKMERDGIDSVMVRIIYGRWRRVTSYTINRQTAELVVYGILAKRQSPTRQPRVCEYCGWCANAATCSAINAIVAGVTMRREDWPLKLPTMHVSQAPNNPVTLGAMRLLWKQYIEPWGKGVEYASATLAQNGVAPLGYDVRDERARAEINERAAGVLRAAGVTEEALADAASYSMTGLVEAYHASLGGTKKAAEAKVEEILTQAGAMSRGDRVKKLIKRKDAEELVQLALARSVVATAEPTELLV